MALKTKNKYSTNLAI